MTVLSQFLIVVDHEQGALHQEATVFTDAADALRAYSSGVHSLRVDVREDDASPSG